MLRIVAHKTAAAACRYYTEVLARGDYYTESREIVGKWHGKAAEKLNLIGAVIPDEFEALANNRHPQSGARLTPRMKDNRRVGYDLTFNCPKSVSLVHALTGDDRIVDAFRSAVAETMADVEEFTTTRVRRRGAQSERATCNLAWAEFVHFTSRPVGGIPDPLLHVHAFAFNVTHDETEDRWKAVSWASIKEAGPYFQASFYSRLSQGLQKLGYGIERTRLEWEIAGIPRTLIDKFSRRTAQIERLARERGITDPKKLDALGAESREKKTKRLTQAQLLAAWDARLAPDERELIASIRREPPKPKGERVTPAKAFDDACEKLFAKESVLNPKRLIAETLRYGIGSVTPDQAWKEFSRREMITREINGEVLCTSLDVLSEELALINIVRSGRGMCAPVVPSELVFTNSSLSAEQQAAARHLLKTNDQIAGVRGMAGTGKTTLMKEVKAQVERQGLKFFAFAPSAETSRETLREEGFANAETVAHLLLNKKLQQELRGQVVWIDEAGTLGVPDLLTLLGAMGRNYSTKVFVTGDTGQHAPVQRGDALRIIQEYAGIKIPALTEIRRQESEAYRKAVAALSKGDLRTGFRRLDELRAIIEVPDDTERYRMLAADFVALSRGKGLTIAVSPTNAEAARVTDAIRAALKEAGKLGAERAYIRFHNLHWEEPDRRHAGNYAAGLVVQFHQNATGIKRGSVFEVTGVNQNGEVLAVSPRGREIVLPLKEASQFGVFEQRRIDLATGDRIRITSGGKSANGRRLNNGNLFNIKKIGSDGTITLNNGATLAPDYGHIAHGYCRTSWSSQGKTVRHVLIAQHSESKFSSSLEQFYVSVSRAKESLRVYTDDRLELERLVGYSSARKSGIELAKLTRKEIADLMSTELDSRQWRELIQSRRGTGNHADHVRNLLKERRQPGITKPQNMDFRQYLAMRRGMAGADGKSRSKGHPHQPGKEKAQAKGRSLIRETQLRTAEPRIIPAQNEAKKPAAKPAPDKLPPRQSRAVKALEASKQHLAKVANRTKTAVQSFKSTVRSKVFPKQNPEQIAKRRVKNQTQPQKPPVKAKAPVKAPTPKPPVPRK